MSWPKVPLKDLGTWTGGGTPSKVVPAFWTAGTIPWLSPKDMGANTLAGTKDHITATAVQGSSVKIVPAGSVVVVVRSGILERTLPVALVPFETTLNQDMKAVTPRNDVDARWIAWGLRAFESELLRDTRKAGTTVASIEMARFNSFTLPVPPLREQRRIVEILEDHLSRLDAAERELNHARTRLHQMLATAARIWLWSESGRLPFAGLFGAAHAPNSVVAQRDYQPSGRYRVVDQGATKQGRYSDAEDAVYRGPFPVIVFGDHTRRVKFATSEFAVGAQGVKLLLPRVEPRYAYWCLASLDLPSRGYGRHYAILRRSTFPNIPLGLQKPVAERLDALEANVLRSERELAAARARSIILRQALLAAAFEGKLTGRHTDAEIIEEKPDGER